MGGTWRVWETLRGWDRRFAIAVDAMLALGLFVLCSGWFVFDKVPPTISGSSPDSRPP